MTLTRLVPYPAGVMAALAVPLWLRGPKFAELVRDPVHANGSHGEPRSALRAAHAALRWLARARLPWWRNTCLYHAVAECLVLRHNGVSCHVELGVVQRCGRAITAHAWVVRSDAAGVPSPANLVTLR